MSILRFSLPLLVVSLLANVLLTPLRSGIDSILPPSNNILLLTAHPDDECMFFAPTILSLTKYHVNEKRPNLYSLCLSVGNAEGLGNIRRDELQRSLDVLGVDQGRRWVVDHPELPDNMTVHWDAHAIADVVRPYIVKYNIGTTGANIRSTRNFFASKPLLSSERNHTTHQRLCIKRCHTTPPVQPHHSPAWSEVHRPNCTVVSQT
ncbi:unnamed protein product [Somion occarium]|uniref:N-acetylglucosaminylphosphatidylinositol deacetylase n=1 Tax=Somion occarium TaxID=3059160 RepID=A0ABP1CX53_9APHY